VHAEQGERGIHHLVFEHVPGPADPVESRGLDESRPLRLETDEAGRG
jgi:hypothetical protein